MFLNGKNTHKPFWFEIHFGGSHDFSHGKHFDEVTADIRCHLIDMCDHVKFFEFHKRRINEYNICTVLTYLG